MFEVVVVRGPNTVVAAEALDTGVSLCDQFDGVVMNAEVPDDPRTRLPAPRSA